MRRSSPGMMNRSYDAGSGGRGLLACYVRAKPRPSKWDDAQRWLSASSSSSQAPDDDRRRSSCADDRLLLPSASQKGRHSWSTSDAAAAAVPAAAREDGEAEAGAETKRMDSVLAYGQQPPRSLSLRDIGTEMTPAGSKEASRANTPRATLAAEPSPAPSTTRRSSESHASRRRPDATSGGSPPGQAAAAACDGAGAGAEERKEAAAAGAPAAVSPATAWDAAERAKHMARYRREEMKIQAWENRRRQKAELEMKMAEVRPRFSSINHPADNHWTCRTPEKQP
ncbi:hypothetical protein SEVIR_1G226200v4 [Setaria viridis]